MSRPDLRAVDELCRLVVAARRLGCRVHLSDADPRLRELLELAGVGEVVCDCPATGPPRPGGAGSRGGDLR